MTRHEFFRLLRRFIVIMIATTAASFLTMITVQYFMGGVQDVLPVLGRSILIGLGFGVIVFVAPKKQDKYPWL